MKQYVQEQQLISNNEQRVILLRHYENYCYQIAYFVLQDADLATLAVSDALIDLYQQKNFLDNINERDRMIKKTVCFHCARHKASSVFTRIN